MAMAMPVMPESVQMAMPVIVRPMIVGIRPEMEMGLDCRGVGIRGRGMPCRNPTKEHLDDQEQGGERSHRNPRTGRTAKV